MKRIFAMVKGTALLLSVALFGLSGCGIQDEMVEEVVKENAKVESVPDNYEETEEIVNLDWYVNFSWYATPFGGNVVSEKITQDTGVAINFVAPQGNENEKFNALISSDTLPDIITLGWWEEQLDVMINRDMVYPLNELADQYDAYFWEVASDKVCKWYTETDGNIYCYPNSSYLPEDYETYDKIGSNQTFLVRKDIYEAIGSPDMTTPEGFSEAVKKAAEMFPEIDGQPLSPIGAHAFTETGCDSFDQFLQNFLAIPHEKDGKYYDRYTDPEYIRWLKVFRQLREEGYLLEDIFIDQRTQMEEKLAQGRYFCMIYQRTDLTNQQKILYRNNPDSIYMAVDGPKNSAGEDPILPGGGITGWTVTLISKKCERPDKAIELPSYLMSEEGQKTIYLGVEDVTYDMVNGEPVVKEEVMALLNSDRTEYDRVYGADDTYWMLQNNAVQLQWRPDLSEPLGQMEEWTYPYTQFLEQYNINFATDSEMGYIQNKISKLWGETLPALLLAEDEDEFDRILDEFVQKREEAGYEELMEASTTKMNEIKEKLDID